MKQVTSKQFEFIYEDLKVALKNSLVYGSPLFLLILQGIQEGKTFEDLKSLVIAWLLQASINLTIKFINVKKYPVKK